MALCPQRECEVLESLDGLGWVTGFDLAQRIGWTVGELGVYLGVLKTAGLIVRSRDGVVIYWWLKSLESVK